MSNVDADAIDLTGAGSYLRYIRTWSAVRLFEQARGRDPLAELELALRELWPREQDKPVSFELVGRVGRRG